MEANDDKVQQQEGFEVDIHGTGKPSASAEDALVTGKALAWYRFDDVRIAQGYNLVRWCHTMVVVRDKNKDAVF